MRPTKEGEYLYACVRCHRTVAANPDIPKVMLDNKLCSKCAFMDSAEYQTKSHFWRELFQPAKRVNLEYSHCPVLKVADGESYVRCSKEGCPNVMFDTVHAHDKEGHCFCPTHG